MNRIKNKSLFPHACVRCFDPKVGATAVGHSEPPMPGGILVCNKCALIMVITEEMTVLRATKKEIIAVSKQDEAKEIFAVQLTAILNRLIQGPPQN